MAFNFKKHWSEEIASVTSDSEYQTASVTIRLPGTVKTDPKTGQDSGVAGATLYTGQARIIGVRWGTFTQGNSQENSDSLKSVRVQIPKDAVGRVLKGCPVTFDSVPRNPALTGRTLRVTNDFQGGSSASRTFECEISAD